MILGRMAREGGTPVSGRYDLVSVSADVCTVRDRRNKNERDIYTVLVLLYLNSFMSLHWGYIVPLRPLFPLYLATSLSVTHMGYILLSAPGDPGVWGDQQCIAHVGNRDALRGR